VHQLGVGCQDVEHFSRTGSCPDSIFALNTKPAANECSEAKRMSGPACLNLDFHISSLIVTGVMVTVVNFRP
jgi:hypothetical protein